LIDNNGFWMILDDDKWVPHFRKPLNWRFSWPCPKSQWPQVTILDRISVGKSTFHGQKHCYISTKEDGHKSINSQIGIIYIYNIMYIIYIYTHTHYKDSQYGTNDHRP
jgi:hypothetical protein